MIKNNCNHELINNICKFCKWEKRIFIQDRTGKNALCDNCKEKTGDKNLKRIGNFRYCKSCYIKKEKELEEKKIKDKEDKIKLRRGNRTLKEIIKNIMNDGKSYSCDELAQILINDKLINETDRKKVKILVSGSINSLIKNMKDGSSIEKIKKGVYKMIILRRKNKEEEYDFMS
jgi:hypothetical protein